MDCYLTRIVAHLRRASLHPNRRFQGPAIPAWETRPRATGRIRNDKNGQRVRLAAPARVAVIQRPTKELL